MKVLFATKNCSKVDRFKNYLKKYDIDLISLNDLDFSVSVIENGKDSISNAIIKARAYSSYFDICFAMDDSLFIDGIPDSLQPRDKVRRVNGKSLSDSEMIDYYMGLVKSYSNCHKLFIKWVYGICLIINSKEFTYSWDKSSCYLTDSVSSVVNPGYPLNSISKYIDDDTFVSESNRVSKVDEEKGVLAFLVNTILDNYDR